MDFKGCSIYYETERRENAKDWVVFLHGAGVDHRMFAEQLLCSSGGVQYIALGCPFPRQITAQLHEVFNGSALWRIF